MFTAHRLPKTGIMDFYYEEVYEEIVLWIKLNIKLSVCFLLILNGTSVFSAGYTVWAKPTTIEYVANGILVAGSFGDINGCGQANYIFIKPAPSNPETFKIMTSIIITAITAQRDVRFYTNKCTSVSFHWNGNVINEAYTGGGFFMR